MKILFVCLGNICRSPIAHGVMEHLARQYNLDWEIDSAGTESFHTGEAPHIHSQRVCKEHGIDISKQVARKFTAEDLSKFDLVYAMAVDVKVEMCKIAHQENTRRIKLFLDELYPNKNASVKDPWYGDLQDYYDVYEQIHTCCSAILKKYM